MPLNKAQVAVTSSQKRFRVFVAGRRTGKTYLSVRELARFARFPKKKVLYVCPTYRMARDIIWEDLKSRLDSIRWIKKINESRLEVTLINDSKIMLRGADNYDSLRGGGYDFVVFDETADIKQEAWTEVIRPALSAQNPPGSALFCGTPKGFGNWFKDLYDIGISGQNDDWDSFQFTTLDGGNVPEEEIEAAKNDLDERIFRQEYMASFETFTGAIYYNFDRATHIKKREFLNKQPILIGIDFNIDPMSASVCQMHGDILHQFDEISIYGSNTEELVEEIKLRYPNNPIICYPDPAGNQRKTSAAGKTDITILQQYFLVKSKKKHDPIRDRINAVNSIMKNAKGQVRFSIDPKCKKSIKCLESHVYKEGSSIPEKGEYDHQNDALGYLIAYEFPIKKDIAPTEKPRRFTHM